MHFSHDDRREHNTYEDGMELSAKDKMTLLLIITGLGLLMVLTVIGIGF
ncbi:hypothetical protein [Cerasicoccus frondis]|nr:hypothetical protein [Cerasicoccus frondis]